MTSRTALGVKREQRSRRTPVKPSLFALPADPGPKTMPTPKEVGIVL